ncbi:MAG: hypothetical protein D6689_01350 [Deltaproteobacteria bacterium]|nr:MAG: hypothetical protein D6689_01350 [Deltaproteobacteria bacterium]
MNWLLTAAALLAIALPAPAARAQSKPAAACDVFEIEANNDGKGIDPGLGGLARVLKKPPFASWSSFVLIARHRAKVATAETAEIALKVGGRLDLTVRDVVRKQGKKPRLRMAVAWVNAKGKKATASSEVDSGDPWLIGGEPMPGKPKSTYFLGIACTVR